VHSSLSLWQNPLTQHDLEEYILSFDSTITSRRTVYFLVRKGKKGAVQKVKEYIGIASSRGDFSGN
jgi:hypothetical protein